MKVIKTYKRYYLYNLFIGSEVQNYIFQNNQTKFGKQTKLIASQVYNSDDSDDSTIIEKKIKRFVTIFQ